MADKNANVARIPAVVGYTMDQALRNGSERMVAPVDLLTKRDQLGVDEPALRGGYAQFQVAFKEFLEHKKQFEQGSVEASAAAMRAGTFIVE